MWTLIFFVACAALTGGVHANTTPVNATLGVNQTLSVVTFLREVATCHLETNTGDIIDFSPDGEVPIPEKFIQQPANDMSKCMVTILNIESSDDGEWKIYFQDSNGTVGGTQYYNLNVVGDVDDDATSSPEDIATTVPSEVEATTILIPEPIETTERKIEYLAEERYDTKIGEKIRIVIQKYDFVLGEKCLIQTPSGDLHALSNINLNDSGLEMIEDFDVECGIVIPVSSENIGDWILIAQATRTSVPIEKRLPFTISVEEFVAASPIDVTVSEGNDLHLRLKDPTNLHSTCKLIPPTTTDETFDIEAKNNDECEYVVKNIGASGTGNWEITYGTSIIFRAIIEVTVSARPSVPHEVLTWVNSKPVNTTVGPEDATYCIISDPSGSVVFEGFGRCRIELERAADRHAGSWIMRVGLPGRVLLEKQYIFVAIGGAEAKPEVVSVVTTDKPAVMLSCSVNSTKEIRACKFRNPQGEILLAREGVGESQYVFHGVGSSYQAGVHSHECGIRINDPANTDLGLWRCALETEDETYYSFLAVLCPWSLSIPEIAANVVTEPTLTASPWSLMREAGEPVTMACAVQAPIRYCYFRANNGTVYTVTPEHPSEDFEYVGAGFEAGECGIRFNSLVPTDSGRWSCHVGLMVDHQEQTDHIQLAIEEPIRTSVDWDHNGHLVVQGKVYSNRPLDYCRFVRMDGFGFLADHAPANYKSDLTQMSQGVCRLVIEHPTVLDRHPWTLVVKVNGHDAELAVYTDHALHGLFPTIINTRSVSLYIWTFTIFLGILMLTLGFILGPKKNRDWTFKRVSSIRNSFSKQRKSEQMLEKPTVQKV